MIYNHSESWLVKIYKYHCRGNVPLKDIRIYRAQPPRWISCFQELKPDPRGYMTLEEWIELLKDESKYPAPELFRTKGS